MTLFADRLAAQVARTESPVCVGLDPDPARFPAALAGLGRKDAIVRFNKAIVEATQDLVCAYKPNLGFYAAQGIDGIQALIETRNLIPAEIPVILDCKVGDMGSTTSAYARGYFIEWGFDAVTANPYQGEDSLAPFLAHPDKAVFILCRTSYPSSGDLQDVAIDEAGTTLYQRVAERSRQWARDYPEQVGLVVGATYPDQVKDVRSRAANIPILLPGIGAQDGDVEGSVSNGITEDGTGLLVSSSREIVYAGNGPDFAERSRNAARILKDRVNAVRLRKTGQAVAS